MAHITELTVRDVGEILLNELTDWHSWPAEARTERGKVTITITQPRDRRAR